MSKEKVYNIKAFDYDGEIIQLPCEVNIPKKQFSRKTLMNCDLREVLKQLTQKWFLERDNNAKKLKALEIIMDKLVNVRALIHSCNLDEYNVLYIKALQLTQEEYDLLKEVLK